MIKKEKSVILCKKKNNSNNIIRKKIIESNKGGYFPSKLFKNQKKITNNEKYRNKNNEKWNNFLGLKTSKSKINNFSEHSHIDSAINSAKKLNNKTINIKSNIWLESEEY